MSTYSEFGQWIRRYRKGLDLTQEDLAKEVACSPTTVRLIEAGRRRPSRLLGERLAEILGVPVEKRHDFIRMARGLPMPGRFHTSDLTPDVHSQRLMGMFSYENNSRLDQSVTNLPTPLTPLIGRAGEVAAISRILRLGSAPLLTLVGPSGVGKTRLSLQVAIELQGDYADGVRFIAFGGLTDTRRVLPVLAEELGVPLLGDQESACSLGAFLHSRHMLLVLDNVEDSKNAAPGITMLLEACPMIQIVVSSRLPFHVDGGHNFAVPLLSLPECLDTLEPGRIAAVLASESVQLFVARAQEVAVDFTLTATNVRAVVEICRLVDGLPLAIELVAAQIQQLPPSALLEQLLTKLATLGEGSSDVPARNCALRAAITLSYDRLTDLEREIFILFSTFAGGCDLKALDAVSPRADVNESTRWYTVLSLIGKNLIRYEVGKSGEPRLCMLETIKVFALEQLVADGGWEAAQFSHARYYLQMAQEVEQELNGPQQQFWLGRLADETDNLWAAMHWAVDQGEAKIGLSIVGYLWRFWWIRGRSVEAQKYLASALALVSTSSCARVNPKALIGTGLLARLTDDYSMARSLFNEALTTARNADDQHGIISALFEQARMATDIQGDMPLAQMLAEECLDRARESNDALATANALHVLGRVAYFMGDHSTSCSFFENSLSMFHQLADRASVAAVSHSLAHVKRWEGKIALARATYEECLATSLALGDRTGVALALDSLGQLASDQNDCSMAGELFRQSLIHALDVGDKRQIASALDGLALVAAQTETEFAIKLAGAASGLRARLGAAHMPDTFGRRASIAEHLNIQLGQEVFMKAWIVGQALPLSSIVKEILCKAS